MAKHSTYDLDMGQLEVMWNFLRFGAQRPNVPALKDLCEQLRQSMVQKTAGQRKDDPENYVEFTDVGTIINSIVVETMALYLSGKLDKLEGDINERAEGMVQS
jgi:hypothetical protein